MGAIGLLIRSLRTVVDSGVFCTLTELPIRGVLPVLMRLPDLTVGVFAAVGPEGCFFTMGLPLVCGALAGPVRTTGVGGFCFARGGASRFFASAVLVMLLALGGFGVIPVLPVVDFCGIETDGFFVTGEGVGFLLVEIVMGRVPAVLVRLPGLVVGGFAAGREDGFLTLIELPIREVLLGLMFFFELAPKELVVGFAVDGEGVGFLLVEIVMGWVLDVLVRLPGLVVGGFVAVEGVCTFFTIIGPPMRLVLLGVMRLLGAGAGGLFDGEGAADGL